MKRTIHILLTASLILATLGASAQMKTAYFMEGSIQRLDMNAAFIPKRGYVTIPGLGNIGVGLNSNYLSVKNLLYPDPDGSGLVTFMHSSVDADDFLRRMRNTNHLDAVVRENIFGIGGFARRYFWSFNINLRSETSLSIPKRFFELAKDLQEGEYDLDGFSANSDNFVEFAIGFAFPVHRNINAGFRVKALAGAGHATINVDKMHVSINDQVWRADMQGRLSGNVAGMNFSNLHGKMPIGDVLDRINFDDFSASRIGSWGLAFDLGADARLLNDRLKVSLGLNDLGFIAWSRKSAINGDFDDLSIAFKGYDFDNEEIDFEKPEDITVTVGEPRGTTRMLTATLNIGGEYAILDNAIGFGLLSQTRFYGNYTSTELTASANFRPCNWFSGSISHSLLRNRLGVLGLALNVHPSWINFFVGMDYIGFRYGKYKGISTIPINLKSINLYFGLAIPITKVKPGGSFSSSQTYHR